MNGPTALREAVGELRGTTGVLLATLFASIGVASIVAQQTLAAASASLLSASDVSTGSVPFDPSTIDTPLSLGLSYGVALVAAASVAVVAEYAAVVTLRVVTGSNLRGAATRRIGRTVAVGFVVGVIVRSLVAAGLVALVLPGVFLAVSLLFAHATVAVDDAGISEALTRAWALSSGRRLMVAGIVSLLAVLYLTPRLLGSLVPGTGGYVVTGIAAGLAGLLSSGIVGRAYLAAKREEISDPDETDTDEETDPYDAPLGPDDLPEPE